MKSKLTKKEAQEKIDLFFRQEEFDSKNARKIKRIAMSYHIRLKNHKKRFCKKCFCNLRSGKMRTNKGYMITECSSCGYKNRWKMLERKI